MYRLSCACIFLMTVVPLAGQESAPPTGSADSESRARDALSSREIDDSGGASRKLSVDVSEVSSRVIQPGVDALPDDEDRRIAYLSEMWNEGLQRIARQVGGRRRQESLEELSRQFAKILSTKLGGGAAEAKATELIAKARALDTQRRRVYLQKNIICKCPKEKWTRTLAGCFEACANGQKADVENGLAAGLLDDEILDRMLQRTGDPRVIFKKRNVTSTLLIPYAVFVVAAVLAACALLYVKKRTPAHVEPNDATLDPALEAELERKLKELDD